MEGEAKLLDLNEELTFEDMGTGRVELLLRFASGLYKGRFLYINTSVSHNQPEGESFGSDPSLEAGLTTYIEQAGLSLRHAEIRLQLETSSYILKDCDSLTGTWVKHSLEEASGIVIEAGDSLLIGSSLVEFTRGPFFNPITEVVEMYRLQDLATSLGDLNAIAYISLDSVDQDVRSRLSTAQQVLRSSPFPPNYLNASALDNEVAIGLQPITLGSSPDCDLKLPDIEQYFVRIAYTEGQFVLSQGQTSKATIFKRLAKDELYILQPGSVFSIGELEFEVCRFNVGRWSECGARPTLEDTEISLQNLFVYDDFPISFFAVYDGHGGFACAEFLKENLHKFIRDQLINHPQRLLAVNRTLHEGIHQAFKECDLAFYSKYREEADKQGSTAIVCLIIGDRIIACNLGDSKAILCRKGRAVELSFDHKPNFPEEKQRIEQNGGFVAFNRLCGMLAISRSFGDFKFKAEGEKPTEESRKRLLSNSPDIREIYINPQDDEFLLLACDGMFEAFTPQAVVTLIRQKLARMQPTEQDPSRVIREVVNEAIYSKRTRDNVTAILVTLSCGITLES